jgi:hypothetical protein
VCVGRCLSILSSPPHQPLRIEPLEGMGVGARCSPVRARRQWDWTGASGWRHQQAAAQEHEAMFAGLQRFVSEARWAFTVRAARRKGLA